MCVVFPKALCYLCSLCELCALCLESVCINNADLTGVWPSVTKAEGVSWVVSLHL